MNRIRVANIILELEFVKLVVGPVDWNQEVLWKGLDQQILLCISVDLKTLNFKTMLRQARLKLVIWKRLKTELAFRNEALLALNLCTLFKCSKLKVK